MGGLADGIATLQGGGEFDDVTCAGGCDDFSGAAADLKAAGIHSGKLTGQAVEQLDPVEGGEADFAGDIEAQVQAIQQAACTDHVVGIIQEIGIGGAGEDGGGHLTAFQKGRAAVVKFTVCQGKARFCQRFFEAFKAFAGAVVVRQDRKSVV